MNKPKAHVAEYKKKVVDDFAKLMTQYPIIGVLDMENLPAQQLAGMRKKLRDTVVLKMTKRILMTLAIDKIKDKRQGIEKLKDYMKGMPALMFTKDDPFKIYKTIQRSKSKASIKAGQIAPHDIIVPAGPTPFAPGPIISDLGSVGIKAGVEGGKIAVKKDSLVAKEGDVISAKLSSVLLRLGIEPMEIGLNLVAIYENGTIYTKDVLSIDDEKLVADMAQAHSWAFNLAVEAKIINKATVEFMLQKAEREAKALDSAMPKA